MNALALARRPGIDTASSTVNAEDDLPDAERQRWSALKMRAQQEAGQAPWRRLLAELEDTDSSLDAQTRMILTSESFTT